MDDEPTDSRWAGSLNWDLSSLRDAATLYAATINDHVPHGSDPLAPDSTSYTTASSSSSTTTCVGGVCTTTVVDSETVTSNPTVVFSVCRDISAEAAVAGLPQGFVDLCGADDEATLRPAYFVGNPNDVVVTESKSGALTTTIIPSGTDDDECICLGKSLSAAIEKAQYDEALKYSSPMSAAAAEAAEEAAEGYMTIGLIDENDPIQGVAIYYKNGDMCTADSSTWPDDDDIKGKSYNSVTLKFICYPGANNHVPFATEVGLCAYEVRARRYASVPSASQCLLVQILSNS